MEVANYIRRHSLWLGRAHGMDNVPAAIGYDYDMKGIAR